MLASLHPSSPTSDQAVKDLLDQRARASHTRYTSVSFSQRSDSPSIYSRGDISPNPVYAPLGELPSRSGHPASVAGQTAFYDAEENSQRHSSVEDSFESTGRYMPAFEDDDNDGTSFIEAPTPRPVSRQEPSNSDVLGPETDSPSMEKIVEDSRMSMLGPKMRFVSRAPWETGEDELLEDDEELATSPDGLSIFGGKVGGWRGKDTDKASVKGLSLATFRSRSPGPPSIKKGGFGLHRHKTPEPSSETPYGTHISNASQSHSAVNTLSSGRSSHSVTDSQSSHVLSYKAPIPRVASGRISPMPQGNVIPPLPSPRPFRTQKQSFSSQDGSSSSSFRSDSPPPPLPFTHPYAHPDLVPTMGPPPAMPLPRTPRKSREHSSELDDRRSSPLRPKSASPQSSPRPANLRKASAGANVLPTPSFWNIDDDDYERETKHLFSDGQPPLSVSTTKSTPSYAESKDSPMRNLISLEQARALAQAPSRPSQGVNSTSTPRSTPTSTLVAGLGLAPGVVENGVVRGQAQRSIPFPHSDPAPQGQNQHHQRQRTLSSGRHIISGGSTTPRPDGDAVPTKNLKHKKSAFLKLFQGGKEKEREKEVSSASRQSVNRAMSTPPQLASSNQPVPPLPGVQNVKRVPPPLLSVVVTSPSVGHSDSLSGATHDFATRPASPPRLRQASSPFPSSSEHKAQESSGQDRWLPLDHPPRTAQIFSSSSSAPPSQTEFKTLSLRPVSTMFSANFPELLSPSSPPSNQPPGWNQNQGISSPATPGLDPSRSNSMSTASDYPVTPSSAKPYSGVPGIISSPAEDQSVFIAALQEQILNSRKAWQRQIWELEGQIKDLKTEVEELRSTGECETCGKAKRDGRIRAQAPQRYGVVDRPRPRMGGDTRSVFGGGNDM